MAKSGFAKDQLKSFINRIERLEEERAALGSDIREVFAEAKSSGFDTKIMRQVIALRRMDTADRQEMEAMRELYMSALGMLGDTPLGEAAVSRAAASPGVKKAIKGLGKPAPVTDEEREKGVVAAFEKDGTRCSIGFPERERSKVAAE